MSEFENDVELLIQKLKALRKSTVELKDHAVEVVERLGTLGAQVQFAVDYMDSHGLLDEHCFTFPDGETVHATQTLLEGDDD